MTEQRRLRLSRCSAARNTFFAQRHTHTRAHQTYRSTRSWAGKRHPSPPTLLTTWSTSNDFNSDSPCGTKGCALPTGAVSCTRCAAPSYVTADPNVIRAQARAIFQNKLRANPPLPAEVVTTHTNAHGDNIAHLVDHLVPTIPLPHPSHASIHSLMHPRHTPAATRTWYSDVMRPPSHQEFMDFINEQKGNSAPGPSKFRYSLLRNAPAALHDIMHKVTCICLLLEGMPASMKAANLYPIPKSHGSTILTEMRPITLLEIGYKLTTGLVAARLRSRSKAGKCPLWSHNQYGGDGGTENALLRFLATLEDSNAHPDKQLLACLADVKAAYDSVSPESKSLAYRKAGLPESFINFAYNLDCDATTSVLVPGLGNAEPFTVGRGFRQGDPLSVIGWLVFFDPLVQWVTHGLPAAAPPISYTPPTPLCPIHTQRAPLPSR